VARIGSLLAGFFAGTTPSRHRGVDQDQGDYRASLVRDVPDGLRPRCRAKVYEEVAAGHYDEALSWARKALSEHPDGHATLRVAAASSALAGRDEDARTTSAIA
jgi:hypothetical protein